MLCQTFEQVRDAGEADQGVAGSQRWTTAVRDNIQQAQGSVLLLERQGSGVAIDSSRRGNRRLGSELEHVP
jgi:hypothetical protein